MIYKVTYIYNGTDDYYLGGMVFDTIGQAKAAVAEILKDIGHGIESVSIQEVTHKEVTHE